MAEKQSRSRHYLSAVFGRAWKEVSFIEVLSEAIGGFMLALFAYFKGWINSQSAFELGLECAGCALLIPVVAFVLRVLIVAPAEIAKESLEGKKKDDINPKSIYPAIVATLLGACSVLVVGLSFSLRFNFVQFERQAVPVQEASISKPLPIKTIPRPEASLPVLTQIMQTAQASNGQTTQQQFETFNPDTNGREDFSTKLANLKAKKEADAAEMERGRNLELQRQWADCLPCFNRSLVFLHDLLLEQATKNGDGLAQSEGYFKSLPPTIDPNVGDFKIAEIRLQKDTNVDFVISVTEWSHSEHRQLLISCSNGYVRVAINWSWQLAVTLHINDPQFDYCKTLEVQKGDAVIKDQLSNLIAAQMEFSRKLAIKNK